MNRPVYLLASSVLAPPRAGAIPDFDPLRHGIARKSLKTMTRAVQLGMASIHLALSRAEAWAATEPGRRGLYVGASPQSGDAGDLLPAIEATGLPFDLRRFAEVGVPLIPPLWLVKGLSNNILGYAAAQHDFRGDNGNWCDGRLGGSVALTAAIHAIAEGRVDLAVAGAADCLVGADELLGQVGSEGAGFVVLSASPAGAHGLARAGIPVEVEPDPALGELGASAGPVTLLLAWERAGHAAAGGVELSAMSDA